MRRIVIIVLVTMAVPCSSALFSGNKIKIILFDIQSKGLSKIFSAGISSQLKEEIQRNGNFSVIDRAEINRLLNKKERGLKGCSGLACAVRIGRALKADKVLTGLIYRRGERFELYMRVVDPVRRVYEFESAVKFKSLRALDNAVAALAEELIGRIALLYKIPEDITASQGTFSNRIYLKWKPVPGVERYLILRSNRKNGDYSIITNTTGTGYNDYNVKEGKVYYYKIRCSSPSGYSKLSDAVAGVTGFSVYKYYLKSIIPGWGQYYYGSRTKGYIFFGCFALTGLGAGITYYYYLNKRKEYRDHRDYPEFVGDDNYRDSYNEKYNEAKKARNIAVISGGLFGIVYAANWIDILFFNRPYYKSGDINSAKSVSKGSLFFKLGSYVPAGAGFYTGYENIATMQIGVKF